MIIYFDWLHWIDISESKSMLVLATDNDEIDCNFSNVSIDLVSSANDSTLNRVYEMIYIPFLSNTKEETECLSLIKECIDLLADDGIIVVSKQCGSKLLSKIYIRIFGNYKTNHQYQDYRGFNNIELKKIKRLDNLEIFKELFCFPSIFSVWTISDSSKFISNFRFTKKKTYKNAIFSWILTSKLFIWFTDYFWFNKLVFIRKKHD